MKTGTIIPLIPPRIQFQPISRHSEHSSQFRPKYIFRPVPDFCFKKKNLKSYLLLLLLVFFFFFWLVLNPSSSFFSSSGFWSCQSPFHFLFVCCTGKWQCILTVCQSPLLFLLMLCPLF